MIVERDDNTPESSEEEAHFPVEPHYHPVNKLARFIYDRLASARLAMGLLVAILLSCLCGGTLFKSEQAHLYIYDSLWFNSILVLLAINTACCFFGRIWRRKITVVSFGMILFHVSFVAMFLAIVVNSLFYFDGILRITEGETVSNNDRKVYDSFRHGIIFPFSRLKGSTTLLKVHRGYKVGGDEKNIAYELSMDNPGEATVRGTVYVNNKYVYNGVEYFRDREGYSLLMILSRVNGQEIYGAHYPLQSYKQPNGSYRYATGTSDRPERVDFPMEQVKPLISLQADYTADATTGRTGTVRFQVWPPRPPQTGGGSAPHLGAFSDGPSPHKGGSPHVTGMQGGGMPSGAVHVPATGIYTAVSSSKISSSQTQLADGIVGVGEKLTFDEYALSTGEVRYWVGMNVRYNPGKPVVLASLWVGLSGLIITMFGRIISTAGKRN